MRNPSPEIVARARQRYQRGDTVVTILADLHVTRDTLYFCLDGAGDPKLEAIPRRRIMLGPRKKRLTGNRVSLVDRLWRTADRQVRDIEKRLRLNQQQPAERERDARVLATVVRTLRDLRALHEAEQEPSANNDIGPANLDDFRRELARKIDGIIARRNERADSGPER